VDTYNGAPESFAGARGGRGRDGWLASFFYSYIIAKDRPTDPAVKAQFTAAIKGAADRLRNCIKRFCKKTKKPPFFS